MTDRPHAPRRFSLRRLLQAPEHKLICLIVLVAITALGVWPYPSAHAQNEQGGPKLEFIRDAEIEHYIRALATPLWRAADLDPDSITIVLIRSPVVNAFVASGMNEFFYTGLLQLADTPEQLAGVIAHETGHIAGGHLIRGNEQMANASAEAILGMILGVAAGAASGNGNAAMAAISGSQQIAERNYLSFSRAQEASADSAGMSFLRIAGITSRGMMEFMGKLAGQEMLPADRQAAYVRTHPLTQDRIDAIAENLKHDPYANTRLPEKFQEMHRRMQAKLLGFLQPQVALLRYTDKDPRLTARYARAIALYLTNQLPRALVLTDGLIAQEPENPFFYELKAQMLFENSRIKEAVTNYKKAVGLLPDSALIRVAYAHAMLEANDNSLLDPAIQQLTEANRIEPHDPETWRFLATAWGRKAELSHNPEDEGLVAYALAEESAAKGAEADARQFADRALKVLPKGTPYWLRAQDIKLSVHIDRDKDR